MTETAETTELARPERSLFRRYLWAWIALMLLGVMLIFWHTCLRSAPLRVSKSTTYFTGPIDPATGRLDLDALARELLYRDIPPEKNGFLLYHSKGEDGLSPVERCDPVYFYAKNVLPYMPEADVKALKNRMHLRDAIFPELWVDYLKSVNWQPEDVALMQEWLDTNAEPLAVLAGVLRRKELWPYVKGQDEWPFEGRVFQKVFPLSMEDLMKTDYFSVYFDGELQSFLCRNRYHRGRGDLDAAWDDLVSAMLLEPTDFRTSEFLREFLEHNELTPEQCRRFLGDLDLFSDFPGLDNLDLYRWHLLSLGETLIQEINRDCRGFGNIKDNPEYLFLGAVDWNTTYREAWRIFDQTVEILQTPGLDVVARKKFAADYLASFSDPPDYEFSRQTLTVRSRSHIIGRILGTLSAAPLMEDEMAERLSELRKILTQKLAEAEQVHATPKSPGD